MKDEAMITFEMFLTSDSRVTFTGRQIVMRRRSVDAKLARNVLVGDLKELFLITVSIIRILPETPKQNIRLKQTSS